MMPNTSVSPAASRNSSSPNCRPFRHCSTKSSMSRGLGKQPSLSSCPGLAGASTPWITERRKTWMAGTSPAMTWRGRPYHPSSVVSLPSSDSPLHRALVVEPVLAVLDDGGHGLEGEIAFRVLHHVLKIEILDREVVVAVLVGTAHRGVIGLAHLGAHGVLLAEVPVHGHHRAVEEVSRVIGLRAVEGRVVAELLAKIGDVFLVGVVGQVVDPLLRAGHAERKLLLQLQRDRVDRERGIERDLTLEPGLGVLGQELHASGAWIEHEHR